MNTENHYQETDLGNISLNPRGEYNPEESYEYLDLVVLEGGSYVCLAENGATITGISPESGKTTQYWQVITIPGSLTPEYIAMHDRVVNLSEQVEADAEEVRTAEQNVSGMELNVTQMQEQTRQSAEAAEQSKDSSAGYAASADASRQAAEESKQNIDAQVTGFDSHVAEKTEEAENDIEAARIAANKAIIAQHEQSVNEVARAGIEAISTAQSAAQTATEKAQAADTSEKNAVASETAAKLSEANATKMAEQVAADKEQVANDRTAVENAKQEMTGSVAQIEQNTQRISELKSDISDTLYNTLYNTDSKPFLSNSLLERYLSSFFVSKKTGENLADRSQFIPGVGAFASDQTFTLTTDLNKDIYGTLVLPAIPEGYSFSGLGGLGVAIYVVLDRTGKSIRGLLNSAESVEHYIYKKEDVFVCFMSSQMGSNFSAKIVKGQVDTIEAENYYEYEPVKTLEDTMSSVRSDIDSIKKSIGLATLPTLNLTQISPIYTVANDKNPSRSYVASLWIDHLITDDSCYNKDLGFTEFRNKMMCFGALNFSEGENVKEVQVEPTVFSSDFKVPSVTFAHRCSKSSASSSKFPKILVIGDSVTDGYLSGYQKYDNDLPNQYWSWVRYFFALDKKEDANDASKNNCKMLGITSINGKSYGVSDSFTLNGTTYKNYAVGKGGWSAEDLNLKTFESEDNLNPFFDEKTSKFSLKTAIDKFKTLADDGVTRLEVGSTAGTEVTDVNAFDFCTPTHVVINLNHNSSFEEYKRTIPEIVNTIKSEYPDITIILMSIDQVGTYFPGLYPEYSESDIYWKESSLHTKNVSIYQYIKESLEDESNGVYVCSGHVVQHPVKSYPSIDNIFPETIGGDVKCYGNHSDGGGPNWHPNNIAHKAWGYQLYSLIKYTLAKD